MNAAAHPAEGVLFVVATPIGNLDDLSSRAAAALREATLVVAEDTRRARRLLSHLGAQAPLLSLHAHSGPERLAAVVERLGRGERVAFVTDAGAPAVSDPGAELVAAARAAGRRVEVVPGPSALISALMAAGLPCARFAFLGFLPCAPGKRRTLVAQAIGDGRGAVFFESPRRLVATIEALSSLLDERGRRIAVCRELTKVHEQVVSGTAADVLAALPVPVRGEVTVVIAEGSATAHRGVRDARASLSLERSVASELKAGASARDAATRAAAQTGRPRREAYAIAVRRANALGRDRRA